MFRRRLQASKQLLVLGLALFVRSADATTPPEPPASAAPNPERTKSEIAALLARFLSPQENPTRAAHERFWAEDLVYTSSAGKVTNKAEILKSFDEAPAPSPAPTVPAAPAEPEPVFSAEDVLVRPYGDVAALTFRLVARNPDGSVQHYRNSGTFLWRDGRWQAVTWQATKVPSPSPQEAEWRPTSIPRAPARL
jgi:hypothetical protein